MMAGIQRMVLTVAAIFMITAVLVESGGLHCYSDTVCANQTGHFPSVSISTYKFK